MINKRTELLVGLFVALAIAAALLLALQVANQGMAGSGEVYKLTARFDNIGGLKPRSSVKVGGVVVGRVSRIYLDEQELIPMVELEISEEYGLTFPDTSSLSILTSGLLGEQFIGLQPGFIFPEDLVMIEEDKVCETDTLLDCPYLTDGEEVLDTKSALVLEDLIGQFLFNQGEE
ncbi:outer membrane lipid asymmetry maintenance protein MlaD [Glaciecola sp. XM2]|jgi:phospholipid/cholesterol/gamma-HCH transport system substrate-binding protein|uniref:outer membrane lipid asymmetry maintenance protein MlaD n=1 Tax=Glaciecola sp. XM2 TaxID=1914931 RepID=UPI001BDE428A|nr:outer membrane lipid asymmetry maintenance protein MlaD [Glaciecola sp. XM2]MBT1452477.1 outer membrane lipid asymmetry maintenance protein MlaD [Glaciecola sp. XM2]